MEREYDVEDALDGGAAETAWRDYYKKREGSEGPSGKKSSPKDKLALVGTAASAVVGLVILVGFAPLAKNVFGGEREGAIEIEDCREFVKVKEGSFTTYVNKLTCISHTLGSYCCRVELEDGFCRTAFCYEKEVDISDIDFRP